MDTLLLGIEEKADQTVDAVTEARRRMEGWFNDGMERLVGAYKRRVQIMAVIAGMLIAVVLNADSIAIVDKLWTDPLVRDALVASAAQSVVDADASNTGTGSESSETPATTPDTATTEAPTRNEVTANVQKLEELSIPLGWSQENIPADTNGWLVKICGLLVSGAAAAQAGGDGVLYLTQWDYNDRVYWVAAEVRGGAAVFYTGSLGIIKSATSKKFITYNPDLLLSQQLTGTITFIYPEIDPMTRRAKVRMEFANPGLQFKPETFVTVLIDVTPNAVVLSGFDPVRREIAREAMQRLMQDGRIHPTRIEEVVAEVKRDIDENIVKSGEDAFFKVGLPPMHPDVVKKLGALKFRYSFSQNVLS